MTPLPNDYAGCLREDCPLSSKCWRYQGAKLRQGERVVIAGFEPKNCESFVEVP